MFKYPFATFIVVTMPAIETTRIRAGFLFDLRNPPRHGLSTFQYGLRETKVVVKHYLFHILVDLNGNFFFNPTKAKGVLEFVNITHNDLRMG